MKTPITYYGGKITMLRHILPRIPAHNLYTEVFCGGAAVYFAKTPVRAEILNDLNGDLITFYRVAKSNFTALKQRINMTLHSRDLHAHAAHMLKYPMFFDDIDRAWAIWALSKMSFAAMLDGSFGYDLNGMMPQKIINAKEDFGEDVSRRLELTTIENRDALEVLKAYDRPDAWHFIDPPYVGSDCGHYDGVWGVSDLARLMELLEQLHGKWMLTMFPSEIIEEYAKRNGWVIHRVERFISASRTNRRMQEEWMICNYDMLDEQPTLGL